VSTGVGLRLAELAGSWSARLEAEVPAAVALRHELHANPQVSGEEEWTCRRVADAITRTTGARLEPVAGTGGVLRLGPPSGPCVAVRAELDGLPVVERTGVPYAATGGVMHACGHDVHLAALVALARAAARVELPEGLLAVLQPREEVAPTGARDVIVSGALERHQARAIIAAHVQPLLPAGVVAADPGPVNAAVDEIEIVVTGRGGHTAYPHLAADPVAALCRCVLALQDVVRAAVDPMHPCTVTVTRLSAGLAPNVIPDVARARGTVRTMYPEDADRLLGGIAEMVAGVAGGSGCTGTLQVEPGEPVLVNDAELARGAAGWLTRFGVPPGASFASCGSDDFATYALAGTGLPILMMFVGAGQGPDGPVLHDPRFLPDDELVADVARAMLAGALAGLAPL